MLKIRNIFPYQGTVAITVLALALGSALTMNEAIAAPQPPQGLSRFNPAGLPMSWRYEGTAFCELDASMQSGETVPVLRLHDPKSGFLLTTSQSEAASAERTGYLAAGTAFFAPAKSNVTVLRFRDPKTGSFFYTTSRDEGTKAGFSYVGTAFYAAPQCADSSPTSRPSAVPVFRYRDTSSGIYLFTAGRESPYQVGVYYFGSFAPSANNIIGGTQKVYGRKDDWWGGVKDFYGKEPGISEDHRGWPGDWPYLKPAIGYYDQSSVVTLEQQINEAADAGLTFFSFYWFWSDAKNDELEPEALASFLHSRNVKRLKFNLSLYAVPYNDDMAINPSNEEKVLQRLVTYFSDPQYLRLPDGRPVFSIGDDRNIRDARGQKCSDTGCFQAALKSFLDALKKRSMEKLGVAPFVQVQAGVPGWDQQPDADGVSCLVPLIQIAGGTPYPSITQETFAPLSRARLPVSPCMLENFDERPRQDILIHDRKVIRYLVGKTDAFLRHNLEMTKEFSDLEYQKLKSPASRIIYLYAWNEWHEGGIIEPNAYSDARDLNIVTDVFQLPRLPSPCLDEGACKLAGR